MADLKPAYLIHGDDEAKLDAWRARLRARAESESEATLETLTGERVSGEFVLDTTPPVPGALTAAMAGAGIHATFAAKDAASSF